MFPMYRVDIDILILCHVVSSNVENFDIYNKCTHRWKFKTIYRNILIGDSILILLLSRLHTMGRVNTKVAVCRRFLLSSRIVYVAFCCLCAVHCMQAAAASFVSLKAVFLACTIGSWTAKNSAQNALEVDIFRSKVKKFFWGGGSRGTAPSPSG